MDKIRMEVAVANVAKKIVMTDRVESLGYVDGDGAGAKRLPAWLIEARGDAMIKRKKSGDGRMVRPEAMLRRIRRKRLGEERQDEAFENLRSRA